MVTGVALVTGAAGGIGAAVVRALAKEGATVAAVDVDADGLRTVDAHGYVADVRDARSIDDVVARVEAELGPIEVLVNVAGILRVGPVAELSDEDWLAVFDVNTNGVFRCCRAVARRMTARRRGAIVTIGSNAAGVPRMNLAAYAASKAATAHFMRCLGLELAEFGVRCNVVAPGSTDTAMQRSMWGDGTEGTEAALRGSLPLYRVPIPLGRIARPDDIAEAVAFLASDRASHITMQTLYVDGGASLCA